LSSSSEKLSDFSQADYDWFCLVIAGC